MPTPHRVLLAIAAGVGTWLVLTLPYIVTDFQFNWFNRVYGPDQFGQYSDWTTLKAFNLWYLDALSAGSFETSATLLGISKKAWGWVLLIAGLGSGFALCLWRYRGSPRGLVTWSALALLAFVLLPTSVHERYLLLPLPFVAMLAALRPRVIPGLLLLIVVALGQVTWPVWHEALPGAIDRHQARFNDMYTRAAGSMPPPGTYDADQVDRLRYLNSRSVLRGRAKSAGIEWGLTLSCLIGSAWIVSAVVAAPQRRRTDDPASVAAQPAPA